MSAEPADEPPGGMTEALLVASRALVAVAARSLASVDAEVTLVQYRALLVLAERGSTHVGELAEALATHASTATRMCDRLVARGLVRRSVARGNRRETLISLTPKGRDVVQRVTDVRRAEIGQIVARIPAAAQQAAVVGLNAFAEAAGELPERSWSLGWS
ncbi:MAG: EstGX1 [Ilumatobacteraceae bacterium]|nr:EstGX1 [Ilumatobacteraceae bacterium]